MDGVRRHCESMRARAIPVVARARVRDKGGFHRPPSPSSLNHHRHGVRPRPPSMDDARHGGDLGASCAFRSWDKTRGILLQGRGGGDRDSPLTRRSHRLLGLKYAASAPAVFRLGSLQQVHSCATSVTSYPTRRPILLTAFCHWMNSPSEDV